MTSAKIRYAILVSFTLTTGACAVDIDDITTEEPDPLAYLDTLPIVTDDEHLSPAPDLDQAAEPIVLAAATETCGVCDASTSCAATCGNAYCRYPLGWVESVACGTTSFTQCNPVACGNSWYYCTNGAWQKGPDTGTRYAYLDDMVCNPEARTMQEPAVHTNGGVDDMEISGTCEAWYKAWYETSYHYYTRTTTAIGCKIEAEANADIHAYVTHNGGRYRVAYRWNHDGRVPGQGVVAGNWEQRSTAYGSVWDDDGLAASVAYILGMQRLFEADAMALGGPGYTF